MKNEITVFQNAEFGEIRTLSIDGEPWFAGKDVAERLGYKDTAKAIAAHVDAEDKGVGDLPTPGGIQEITIINESGLYSLILSSKLPKAKAFKRWVTSEVIPAIRKTGGYRTNAENLFRCAEIMASCRPENLPQVMNILGQIVPGIGGEKPVCEAPALPQTNQLPAIRKHTRCEEKFNFEELERLMREKRFTDSRLEKLIGCSEGMVSRWRHGYSNPSVEYRQRICSVFGVSEGYFDLMQRRKRK